jgi:hypothetical protein
MAARAEFAAAGAAERAAVVRTAARAELAAGADDCELAGEDDGAERMPRPCGLAASARKTNSAISVENIIIFFIDIIILLILSENII